MILTFIKLIRTHFIVAILLLTSSNLFILTDLAIFYEKTLLAVFVCDSFEHGNIAVVLALLETVCPRVLLEKLPSCSLDTKVVNQHGFIHLLHRDGTSDQIFIFESLPFLIFFDVCLVHGIVQN